MTVFLSVVGLRVIFITGLTNLLFGLLVLFSCRWVPLTRLTKGLQKSRIYMQYYRFHTCIWRLFWISVAIQRAVRHFVSGLPVLTR